MRSAPIDHAIVTDTDSMQQGGYALVAASAGVTTQERLVLGETSGVSDYLHHTTEDRTYFSFFPIGERYAFVRRFTHGRRRNDSQNRVVAHTLLLGARELDALDWLPWLIAEASFGFAGGNEQFHLTKDAIRIPDDGTLPQLDFEIAVDSPGIHHRLQRRIAHIHAQLGEERTSDLLAGGIAAVAQRKHLMLPQGPAFEQLALAIWSLLPRGDRREVAWTQHLSPGLRHAAFGIANAAEPRLMSDLYGGHATWRLLEASSDVASEQEFRDVVDRQLASPTERARFAMETDRWDLRFAAEPDRIRRWVNWSRWMGSNGRDLQTLGRALRGAQRDPWIDGAAVLRFGLDHAKRSGAIDRALQDLRTHAILEVLIAAPARVEDIDELSTHFDELFVLTFLTHAAAGSTREREIFGVAAEALMRKPPATSDARELAMSLIKRLRVLDPTRAERLVEWLPKSADVLSGIIATLSEDESSLATLAELYGSAADEKGRNRIADRALAIIQNRAIDARVVTEWLDRLRNDTPRFLQLLVRAPSAVVVSTLENLARTMSDTTVAATVVSLLTDSAAQFLKFPSFGSVVAAFARRGHRADLWFHCLVNCARSIDASGNLSSIAELSTIVNNLAAEAIDELPGAGTMAKSIATSLDVINPSDECLRAVVDLGGPRLMAHSGFCKDLRGYWQRNPARIIDWRPIAVKMMQFAQPIDASHAVRDWWMTLPIEQLSHAREMVIGLDHIAKDDVVIVVGRWSQYVPQMSANPAADDFIIRLRTVAQAAGMNGTVLWVLVLWREWKLHRASLGEVFAAADDPAAADAFNSLLMLEFRTIPEQMKAYLQVSREALLPTTRSRVIDRICLLVASFQEDQWTQLRDPAVMADLLREWRVGAAAARALARHPKHEAVKLFVHAAVEASAFDVLAVLQQAALKAAVRDVLQPARSQPGAFFWLGGVAE